MNRIKFTKLFGRFYYDIELRKDGITILTGPNGFGKSTILRCIDAFQNGLEGIIYLINLDFEKIEFIFENSTTSVKKEDGRLYIDKSSVIIEDVCKKIFRMFYRPTYFRHIPDEFFYDRIAGKKITTEEILSNPKILNEIIDNSIPLTEIFSRTFTNKIEILKKQIGNIFFIREQRLLANKKELRRQEDKVVNIIEELPERLKKQIGEISEKYSKVANEYDSSYPYRLFNEKSKIDKTEYDRNMREMEIKFEKLKEYDISEINTNRKIGFKEEYATALKFYFEDFTNKYKVYEEFINRLDLYIGIINSRLTFKKLRISREYGIQIIDEKKKVLKLSDLSSGEQQEIVLFYELIFETPNNSLLLIDEPEISLHIIWQKIFMDDLQKVVKIKNLKVIVATHSPQIINNYWDNQVDLGELYGN